MDKDSKKSRLFSWLDRMGEVSYFSNIDPLNLTNLSNPPLNYETKYSTRPDKNDFE
jgi:hypothetical protein